MHTREAGFSNSLPDQLKQILEVVGLALVNVNRSLRKATKQEFKSRREAEARNIEEARRTERIRQGTWHDGRLDCVAGNGIMSELGVGDEVFSAEDSDGGIGEEDGAFMMEELKKEKEVEGELRRKERTAEELETIAALPIVVIKNYGARGSVYREELQNVLSQWAATLVENKVRNLTVTSMYASPTFCLDCTCCCCQRQQREREVDHTRYNLIIGNSSIRSSSLLLALPSKPLNSIPLYDADTGSALAFVKQRLCDAGMTAELTGSEVASIECLGGRASDLEIVSSLTHPI